MHQQLFDNLFKNEGGSDKISFLKRITKEYPYFIPAHFFLLQNTDDSHEDYDEIASSTAFFFNNPFLLNYRLNQKPMDLNSRNAEISDPKENTPAELEISPVREEELLFQPLYTSDYFASQGIKLSDEIKDGDKLGKQLKSFTDWLKSMKKIQDPNNPTGTNMVDPIVEQLAEKSNREDDILTESMAEVYFDQGKYAKARDVYRKLSLLNPLKSAYFAAKIESLKDK